MNIYEKDNQLLINKIDKLEQDGDTKVSDLIYLYNLARKEDVIDELNEL